MYYIDKLKKYQGKWKILGGGIPSVKFHLWWEFMFGYFLELHNPKSVQCTCSKLKNLFLGRGIQLSNLVQGRTFEQLWACGVGI